MRGLELGQTMILVKGYLWITPHVVKGVGDGLGDSATLSLLLCPSGGKDLKFGAGLAVKEGNIPSPLCCQYPLPLSSYGQSACPWVCSCPPNAQSLGGRYTHSLPSSSVHWCLSIPQCPCSCSLSGFWPAYLSISVCLSRIHGGRTKLLSLGLRSRTLSLLLLTQPYE